MKGGPKKTTARRASMAALAVVKKRKSSLGGRRHSVMADGHDFGEETTSALQELAEKIAEDVHAEEAVGDAVPPVERKNGRQPDDGTGNETRDTAKLSKNSENKPEVAKRKESTGTRKFKAVTSALNAVTKMQQAQPQFFKVYIVV